MQILIPTRISMSSVGRQSQSVHACSYGYGCNNRHDLVLLCALQDGAVLLQQIDELLELLALAENGTFEYIGANICKHVYTCLMEVEGSFSTYGAQNRAHNG